MTLDMHRLYYVMLSKVQERITTWAVVVLFE